MATPMTDAKVTSVKYRSYHQLYTVSFGGTTIKTLVTRSPEIVDSWIRNMRSHENNDIDIIGLDIEWRSRSVTGDHTRPSTLQLCTVQRSPGTKYFAPEGDGKDYKCLIFQIKQCGKVPESIIKYLGDKSCVFVSDRMTYVKEKLHEHYKLDMAYPIDISEFLKVEKPEKPDSMKNSDWDKIYLDPNQVRYACLDAFVSYQEASRFINANKGRMQVPHGLSSDRMAQYLFGKIDPKAVLVEKDYDVKTDPETAVVEEDYDVIVPKTVPVEEDYDMMDDCDEDEEDYDVILHNEVYDV